MLAALNRGAPLRAAAPGTISQTGNMTVDIHNVQFSWIKNTSPTLYIQSFEVNHREKLLAEGPSGCGKSTFLGILAGVSVLLESQLV
jgi:putative ABC transport system ATP-binding protein